MAKPKAEDHAQAAEKRAAAMAAPGPATDRMVAALLEERRGYVQRGMPDRVAQVDESLRYHGAEPPAE